MSGLPGKRHPQRQIKPSDRETICLWAAGFLSGLDTVDCLAPDGSDCSHFFIYHRSILECAQQSCSISKTLFFSGYPDCASANIRMDSVTTLPMDEAVKNSIAQPSYRRLPGRGLRPSHFGIRAYAVINTLWISEDHLLSVDTTKTDESYKRFYFQDIQAVLFQKTQRGQYWNLFWLMGLFLFGLIGLFNLEFDVAYGIVPFLVLFTLSLLINIYWGPTCRCFIVTQVQKEELPAWNRLRKANRGMAQLRPHIEQAQGRLTPEETQFHIEQQATNPSSAFFSPPVKELLRHCNGQFHAVLFVLLLVDSILALMYLATHFSSHSTFNYCVTAGEVFCLFGAFISQRQSDMSPRVKMLLQWFAVCFASFFVSSLFYGIFLSINAGPVRHVSNLEPWNNPLMMVMTLLSTAVNLFFGILGMIALRRFRRENPPQ